VGKFVRLGYQRNGRPNGIRGLLKKVEGNTVVIGGIKILNLTDYTIEEITEDEDERDN